MRALAFTAVRISLIVAAFAFSVLAQQRVLQDGRPVLAISNDNDFDSEESKYDSDGNNLGKGKKSQILLISLDKPLPLPKATVSAR